MARASTPSRLRSARSRIFPTRLEASGPRRNLRHRRGFGLLPGRPAPGAEPPPLHSSAPLAASTNVTLEIGRFRPRMRVAQAHNPDADPECYEHGCDNDNRVIPRRHGANSILHPTPASYTTARTCCPVRAAPSQRLATDFFDAHQTHGHRSHQPRPRRPQAGLDPRFFRMQTLEVAAKGCLQVLVGAVLR